MGLGKIADYDSIKGVQGMKEKDIILPSRQAFTESDSFNSRAYRQGFRYVHLEMDLLKYTASDFKLVSGVRPGVQTGVRQN